MRLLVAVLVLTLSGCATNNPYVVEVNGRKVLFESFRSGRVPAGMEIVHFSPGGIRVVGDTPIAVNGVRVTADHESVTIEDQRFTVHPNSRFSIDAQGELQIQMRIPPAVPPAKHPEERND